MALAALSTTSLPKAPLHSRSLRQTVGERVDARVSGVVGCPHGCRRAHFGGLQSARHQALIEIKQVPLCTIGGWCL